MKKPAQQQWVSAQFSHFDPNVVTHVKRLCYFHVGQTVTEVLHVLQDSRTNPPTPIVLRDLLVDYISC